MNVNYKLVFLCLLVFSLKLTHAISQDDRGGSALDLQEVYEKWFLQQQDSNYIQNYTMETSVRLIGVTKINYFQVRDKKTQITYHPDAKISLGVGITRKWFSLDITFKSGIAEENAEGTKAFDFQGKIFSPMQYLELTYKYYFGYYLGNSSNLTLGISDSARVRQDIRTSYIALDYMYAFNYGRFSFKAPFIYNEIQKKSAGSFLIGAGFLSYLLDGDRSILPEESKPDFNSKLSFESLNTMSLSIEVGYMYSIVFLKKFYITLSAIPGVVVVAGDYKIDDRELIGLQPSLKFKTMNAIGYNSRRFYAGLQFTGNVYFARLDRNAGVEIGHGKGKIFFGYRIKRK